MTGGPEQARTAAAIDAGSNTILLVAGERDAAAPAGYRVIAEEIEFARLGEGVDRTGRLADAAIERGLAAFRRYAGICRELGVDRVVSSGTSALRDAANVRDFLSRVKAETGVEVEVIDGEREARLGFASATDELPEGTPAVVLDVGGGSAQLMAGHARRWPTEAVSFQLGAVRLTERHVKHDPPTTDEVARITADVEDGLARGAVGRPGGGAPLAPAGAEVIGVSGTCTTLAAISLGMTEYDASRIHGIELRKSEIERLLSVFLGTDTAGRTRLPGLHPRRADVIVAGTIVALRVLARYGRDRLRIADRGIRHALLREALLAP